jgi:hypothetical protein
VCAFNRAILIKFNKKKIVTHRLVSFPFKSVKSSFCNNYVLYSRYVFKTVFFLAKVNRTVSLGLPAAWLTIFGWLTAAAASYSTPEDDPEVIVRKNGSTNFDGLRIGSAGIFLAVYPISAIACASTDAG